VFIPNYGPRTDWLRNVMAAGTASLRIDVREIELDNPRLVRKDSVWQLLRCGWTLAGRHETRESVETRL